MKITQFYDPQLSKHFRLSEFTRSGTALRRNLDNNPDVDSVEALQELCIHVLEPLRRRFGIISITSGFRSAPVNAAIGGSPTSQHLRGEAADIFLSNNEVGKKMFYYIRDNLVFDQLLLEFRHNRMHCLHVSYRADGNNRMMARSYYDLTKK